jgi:hypothetical protein
MVMRMPRSLARSVRSFAAFSRSFASAKRFSALLCVWRKRMNVRRRRTSEPFYSFEVFCN